MNTTTKPSVATQVGIWVARVVRQLRLSRVRNVQQKMLTQVNTILRDKRKRLLVFVPLVVVLLALFALAIALPRSKTKTPTLMTPHAVVNQSAENAVADITLPKQIENMATQLQRINATLSNNGVVTNIDSVRQTVASLSQKMTTLAAQSQQLLTAEISNATAPMQQQLIVISAQLKTLQKKDAENTVVSATHLPFTVVQIDNIQQTNVVTLNYNHQTFPIDVGDSVGGWKLAAADFAAQTARFVNRKQQIVKLALNQMGAHA